MQNLKQKVLRVIQEKLHDNTIICRNGNILDISNLEFNRLSGPKEGGVKQFNNESIYYEQISKSMHVNAEFACKFSINKGNDTLSLIGVGSFSGDLHEAYNQDFDKDSCSVIIKGQGLWS